MFSLGFDPVSENLEDVEQSLPQSGPFIWGRTTGDILAFAAGILEIVTGGGAIGGGGVLCLTKIGCIVGAPAIATGSVGQLMAGALRSQQRAIWLRIW